MPWNQSGHIFGGYITNMILYTKDIKHVCYSLSPENMTTKS